MSKLALRQAPLEACTGAERLLQAIEEEVTAASELLAWLHKNVPESQVDQGVAQLEALRSAQRHYRRCAMEKIELWRWLAARLFFVISGRHIEDVEHDPLAGVTVDGNIYDIRQALATKRPTIKP